MKRVNLVEYIHPKMDVLFLALNAPEVSNANAHWFSRNLSFWNVLFEAGLITERIYNPLEGDEKIFGDNAINYKQWIYGVTDLNRELVETKSNNVITTKDQVDTVLEILDRTDTKKLVLMHSSVAAEFAFHTLIKRNFVNGKNRYGKVGEYKNTEIFEVPFHNASIADKVSYYKLLFDGSKSQSKEVKNHEIKQLKQLPKTEIRGKIFYLPDAGNSITQSDIEKGVLRITAHAKPYFNKTSDGVNIKIKDVVRKIKYTQRGRSDLLHIGKQAIQTLQLKEGNALTFERLSNGTFKIEKV